MYALHRQLSQTYAASGDGICAIPGLILKCHVVDDRADVIALVASKLGNDFQLVSFRQEEWTPDRIAGCDVIIVAVSASGGAGYEGSLDHLQRVVLNAGITPVLACIAESSWPAVRDAIAAGAYDCVVENAPLQELQIVLRRAAQCHDLRRELDRIRRKSAPLHNSIYCDPEMIGIDSFARRIAPSTANVLLTGETGTGKEVLARTIHEASGRGQSPFVPVACSSLPESLIEAELFGHERGAFTGAASVRIGRFEAAACGTIFLDEIGELTPALQVKLLRVLQERKFERLGSNKPRPMEARVICATNRNLKAMVRAGEFRADLFYRLNTVEIFLPPLRQRHDDISILALLFLERFANMQNGAARRFSPAALSALQRYEWPGNVRELEHVVERAVVICDQPEIGLEHLPGDMLSNLAEADSNLISFEYQVKVFKRRLIQRTLEKAGQNKVQAARALQISRSSLHRLLDELEIPPGPIAMA